MKKLLLIKLTKNVQLGHLYEHLFCIALVRLFREHKLYAYLDYYLEGVTFYKGYIRIEITLFTDGAVKLIPKIESLRVDMSDENVNGALIQVLAEKMADVSILNKKTTDRLLKELDEQPWITGSELSSVNVREVRTSHAGFRLEDRAVNMFRTLTQELVLGTSLVHTAPETYMPLFAVVADVLGANLREALPDHYFSFTYDDDATYTKQVAIERNFYRVDRRQTDALTDEAEFAREFARTMINDGLIAKLASFLQNANYTVAFAAPNDQSIYERTGYLVGSEGWKVVGTEQNVRAVLEHITVRYRLGNEVQEATLV